MSVGVQIGLLLSVATALASIVGFLYKHRGASASPDVDWHRPVWSTFVLFRSPAYALGVGIALTGWFFHVGALALAPISLVQATIAGGLVLLTVVADRFFDHPVSRREWIGVALAAVGLAFLAATLDGGAGEAQSDYETATLAIFVALVIAASDGGRRRRRRHAGAPGSCSARPPGLMWAASDTTIKALSDALGEDSAFAILFSPMALLILVLSLAGLLVSARSLQIGPAVPVIAVTSVAANALTIAAGPIVFSEPLPDDTLGLVARIGAFVLVIGAAAMTPPPLPAEAKVP